MPNWLPLKLSLLGYAFAGKKTLADLVQQKYGLEVISVEDLINECIDIVQAGENGGEDREDMYGFIETEKRRQIRE